MMFLRLRGLNFIHKNNLHLYNTIRIEYTKVWLTFDRAVPNKTIHPHPPSGGINFILFSVLTPILNEFLFDIVFMLLSFVWIGFKISLIFHNLKQNINLKKTRKLVFYTKLNIMLFIIYYQISSYRYLIAVDFHITNTWIVSYQNLYNAISPSANYRNYSCSLSS